MQSLWARAAQARCTCRCSFCISPNGLASRRTVLNSAKRAHVKGDFFLVLSSTLAFNAAVIDAARKKARARQWDRTIASERERVAAVDADHQKRMNALVDNVEQTRPTNASSGEQIEAHQDAARKKVETVFYRTEWRPVHTDRPAPMKYLDWKWQGVFSWVSKCDDIRAAWGFQNWRGVPLQYLVSLSTEEAEELYRDKRLLYRYYGGPNCAELVALPPAKNLSFKKLRSLEWSVLKMVIRLLQECRRMQSESSTPSETENALPLSIDSLFDESTWETLLTEANEKLVNMIFDRNDQVFYETFEKPAFPNYIFKGDDHDDEIIVLNDLLYTRLKQLKSKKDLVSVITLVCVELLTTTTALNIHAYNLLLVKLCQLREGKLVWIVYESLGEAHVRPNEITHATLLRFFTMTDDNWAFVQYTHKMMGRNRGLALADPDQDIHPLIQRQFRRFGSSMQKIAVLARKNQEVYSALIVGALRFLGETEAMWYYREMIEEGWRPTSEILVNILRSCYIHRDWVGGVAVWEEFRREAIKVTTVAYEWMLRLCRACYREDAFTEILNEGVQQGMLTTRLLDLPLEVRMRDVNIILKQAENSRITSSIAKKVPSETRKRVQKLADMGGPHLLENALSNTNEVDDVQIAKLESLEHSVLRMAALQGNTNAHETELARAEKAITSITDEVLAEIPHCEISIHKYRVHLAVSGSRKETNPPSLLSTYRGFKRHSGTQIESEGRLDMTSKSRHHDANTNVLDRLDANVRFLDTWEAYVPVGAEA